MSATVVCPQPLRRTSLAEAAYETLLEAIILGQLVPGEELSAVALAERFQVSRTPITEALLRLAHDGLIDQPPGRQPRIVKLTRQDVIEIYDMRGHLESAAAERAATRMSDAALSELRAQAQQLQKSRTRADWAARAIDYDLIFHDAIAAAAENERLRADISRYRRLVRSFCRLTGDDRNLRAALDEHRDILAALAARRPAAARKAMATHIAQRLASVLAELFPRGA